MLRLFLSLKGNILITAVTKSGRRYFKTSDLVRRVQGGSFKLPTLYRHMQLIVYSYEAAGSPWFLRGVCLRTSLTQGAVLGHPDPPQRVGLMKSAAERGTFDRWHCFQGALRHDGQG